MKEQHRHVHRLGLHSNMMLRFMGQALQDPPLCSSTVEAILYLGQYNSVIMEKYPLSALFPMALLRKNLICRTETWL
jgi:hypothetical protein